MTYPPTFANVTITAPCYWLPTIERWLRLWSESGKRRPDSLSISCKNDVVTLTAKCNGREVSREVAFHEASSPAGEAVMREVVGEVAVESPVAGKRSTPAPQRAI